MEVELIGHDFEFMRRRIYNRIETSLYSGLKYLISNID